MMATKNKRKNIVSNKALFYTLDTPYQCNEFFYINREPIYANTLVFSYTHIHAHVHPQCFNF